MWTQVRRAGASALIFLLGAAAEGCIPDDDCSVTATCPPPEMDAADADASIARRDASTLPDASVDTTTQRGDALMPSNTVPPVDGAPASDAAGAVPCADGTKRCGVSCVAIDDANFGCGPTSCDKASCPDPGTGSLVCQAGTCVIGACPEGKKNCGGACVDVNDAKYGCGFTSCTACSPIAGASVVCQGGACAVGSCPSGFKKCVDKCVAVGDVNYGCGDATCDKSNCPLPGTGTLGCQAGACVITACGPGTKKCGGKCVAVDDPTYGCGATACDPSVCPAPGAGTLVCSGNACVIGNCGPGTKKCGSKCVPTDVNNGCADAAKCSACAASESCVGTPSKCQCVPNNDPCAGKNCGMVVNNCGDMVSCGACVAPQSCKGAGVANNCGCTPVNPCIGGKCGKGLSDGCGGTVDCNCSGTNTCGGGGAAGVCGCTKKSCSGLCGAQSDGCGGTMQCPACCVPKTVCGANDCGSVPNNCGGTLQCKAPKTCGANDCGSVPDGCGGTLSCKAAKTCAASDCGKTIDTGCGSTLKCPACCIAKTCAASDCGKTIDNCGTPLVCPKCCTPACPAGQCGTVDDGCNGKIACPNCASGLTCNTSSHACECKDNGQACAGKTCGTTRNNCGDTVTCQPNSCQAPPETLVSCVNNQCGVSCPSNAVPLTCGTSAAPACGLWNFNNSADASLVKVNGDAWDKQAPQIRSGALTVGFTASGNSFGVTVRLCPSGARLPVDDMKIIIRYKIETNTAQYANGALVQVFTFDDTIANGTPEDMFLSLDPPVLNAWTIAEGHSKNSGQMFNAIEIGPYSDNPGAGTLYIDYIQILPANQAP